MVLGTSSGCWYGKKSSYCLDNWSRRNSKSELGRIGLAGCWLSNWKGIVVEAGDTGLKKLGFWAEVELGGRLEE